jgi:hypothetical protein
MIFFVVGRLFAIMISMIMLIIRMKGTHDLQVERFYTAQTINDHYIRAEGSIKTFPLGGIKDSPPYLHDWRLLTLEGVVG